MGGVSGRSPIRGSPGCGQSYRQPEPSLPLPIPCGYGPRPYSPKSAFQARIQDGRTRPLAKPNADFFNVIRLTRTVKGVPLELRSGHFSCNAIDWQLSDFRKKLIFNDLSSTSWPEYVRAS
jgi:hypothetical protein